ncbi:MAG: PaaI family thioesterase [Anaerolineales bacterium]|nr:PaaI family thioesterase [Anaerolineales bacterium]
MHPPDFISPDVLRQVSGLEVLQGIIDGRYPPPPIGQLFDFVLSEVADGRAVFSGTPQFKHYNPLGTVHGGYIATLLDSAMACAVQTTLPAGMAYTSVEIKVNFVRPLTSDTGRVRAEGSVISTGRRLATAEGRLVDAAGKLYAHGTTTCLLFPVP